MNDRRYDPIFEESPNPIFIIDHTGRVIKTNLAGRGLKVDVRTLLSAAVDNKTVRVEDDKGALHILEPRVLPLAENEAAIVAEDVTRLKDLEAQLAQMMRVDSLGYFTA